MLKEQGVVIEIQDQFAIVQTERYSHCHHCTTNAHCGTASLATLLGRKHNRIKVINSIAAQVGDKVMIGLEEQALLKGSFLLYLLPLLTLLVAGIGYDLLASKNLLPRYEILTVISALLGFLMGLIGVKKISLKESQKTYYQPIILKKE